MWRAFCMLSAVSTVAVSPQATCLAREQQRLRKSRAHQIDIVQGGENGAAFLVPAPHERRQVGRGLGVDRVERLVQHDQPRILQQQPREQHALHLPARQRADGAPLEAGETDRGDRSLGSCARSVLPMPPKQSGLAPQSHRDEVVDA